MLSTTKPFDQARLVPAPNSFLKKAYDAKQVTFSFDEKDRRVITYIAANKRANYEDPEEWVRAEYWAELMVIRELTRYVKGAFAPNTGPN